MIENQNTQTAPLDALFDEAKDAFKDAETLDAFKGRVKRKVQPEGSGTAAPEKAAEL